MYSPNYLSVTFLYFPCIALPQIPLHDSALKLNTQIAVLILRHLGKTFKTSKLILSKIVHFEALNVYILRQRCNSLYLVNYKILSSKLISADFPTKNYYITYFLTDLTFKPILQNIFWRHDTRLHSTTDIRFLSSTIIAYAMLALRTIKDLR